MTESQHSRWRWLFEPFTSEGEKKLVEWLIALVFDGTLVAFIGNLITVLAKVGWSEVVWLAVLLFLAILFGYLLVRRMSRNLRAESAEYDPAVVLERQRSKEISKFFQKLEDEGAAAASDLAVMAWVSDVECGLLPLLSAGDIEQFQRVSEAPTWDLQKRRCLAWLAGARIKYWALH